MQQREIKIETLQQCTQSDCDKQKSTNGILPHITNLYKEHGQEIQTIKALLSQQCEKVEGIGKCCEEIQRYEQDLKNRCEEIQRYEQDLRNRYEEIQRHEQDLENRCKEIQRYEQDLRGRCKEILRYEQDLRDRCEEIQRHEQDARNCCEETQRCEQELRKRCEDIEHREQWTRERFEEVQINLDRYRRELDTTWGALQGLQRSDQSSGGVTLSFYDKKTYAQSGEDAIVAYIMQFFGINPLDITYLDLGANHAKDMSNSYYFYQQGARGVLVEANPELVEELKKIRPKDIHLNGAVALGTEKCIDFYVLSGDGLSTTDFQSAQEACRRNPNIFIKNKYEVKTLKVCEILRQYFPKSPTILSVDIEGIELEILKQIDFNVCRPLVILVESIPYHPFLPINEKEQEKIQYLTAQGYSEYAFTGINSVMVDERYVRKFNEGIIRENKKKVESSELL